MQLVKSKTLGVERERMLKHVSLDKHHQQVTEVCNCFEEQQQWTTDLDLHHGCSLQPHNRGWPWQICILQTRDMLTRWQSREICPEKLVKKSTEMTTSQVRQTIQQSTAIQSTKPYAETLMEKSIQTSTNLTQTLPIKRHIEVNQMVTKADFEW